MNTYSVEEPERGDLLNELLEDYGVNPGVGLNLEIFPIVILNRVKIPQG